MQVVQITDTHIRKVEAPHPAAPQQGPLDAVHLSASPGATLAACLSHVTDVLPSETGRTTDLVVMTGDLAHGDLEGGAPYGRLKQILQQGLPDGLPVELLPGNHDRRAPLAAAFPSRPSATAAPSGVSTLAGAAAGGMLQQRWLPPAPGDLTTFARMESCGWLLVGLDSLVEGAGHGALGATQLGWLEQTLARKWQSHARLLPCTCALLTCCCRSAR